MALEHKKETEEKIRTECWNQAKQCFGYSYIFSKKATINSKLLNIIKVLGLIVPFIIGIVALGDTSISVFSFILYSAGILMSIQAIISAYAIFNKWDDKYAYFIESKIERGILSDEFRSLANFPFKSIKKLKTKHDILKSKLYEREKQDAKYEIKEWELRMGMRAALREFQAKCVGCGKQPLDMEPSNCKICGNYKKTLIYKFFRL